MLHDQVGIEEPPAWQQGEHFSCRSREQTVDPLHGLKSATTNAHQHTHILLEP